MRIEEKNCVVHREQQSSKTECIQTDARLLHFRSHKKGCQEHCVHKCIELVFSILVYVNVKKIKNPNRSKIIVNPNHWHLRIRSQRNDATIQNEFSAVGKSWLLTNRIEIKVSRAIIDSKMLWSGGIPIIVCAHEHLKNHNIVTFSVICYEIIFGGILCSAQYEHLCWATIYVV